MGRAARLLFTAHLGLIAFSTAALTTILNGPPGSWLQEEPSATVFRIAWTLSGPTYVVLGALCALAHAAGAVGVRRALALLGAAAAVSLGVELLGTSTALPFGEYHYTPLLGYRVLGLVPFPIPLSWFYMLYASVAIVGRLATPRTASARWRWAILAGLVLVAWDVSMDPAMVHTSHWTWGRGDLFRSASLPGVVVDFFTRDAFYGMPLSNWLGWFIAGTLIARLMLAIVPPAEVASAIAPSRLPVLLYLANGIMPVAICFRDGLTGAAWLGAAAMLLPAAAALAVTRPIAALPGLRRRETDTQRGAPASEGAI
jgi:putative membrane protein